MTVKKPLAEGGARSRLRPPFAGNRMSGGRCGGEGLSSGASSQGTIVYFGCPAEEGGAGKAFMVREAALRTAISAWPGIHIPRPLRPYQALPTPVSSTVHRKERPMRPHPRILGRSALDAVELMNVGCNYMREHMILMPECTMR